MPAHDRFAARSIMEMTAEEARNFLLKADSYRTFDLPAFLDFSPVLDITAKQMERRLFTDISGEQDPAHFTGINHTLHANKDGGYAWRPFELIHPTLYVSLANLLTEESHWQALQNQFSRWNEITNIECISLPVEAEKPHTLDKEAQIINWWSGIEQRSIELALDYGQVIHADLSDCYGQIRSDAFETALADCCPELARGIMTHLRAMHGSESRGLPQGSVLTDLLAEIVLHHVDERLSSQLTGQIHGDYLILRYRDDYRIFFNDARDGGHILAALTETLIPFGLKLNGAKTLVSNEIITASIKQDKLAWLFRARQAEKSPQKALLILHDHALNHPNGGSLIRGLSRVYDFLEDSLAAYERWPWPYSPTSLISILTDMARRNPRLIPLCLALISQLLPYTDNAPGLLEKMLDRLASLAHPQLILIWFQRLALPWNVDVTQLTRTPHACKLCRPDKHHIADIWNCSWINDETLMKAFDAPLVKQKALDTLPKIIPAHEVRLFLPPWKRPDGVIEL